MAYCVESCFSAAGAVAAGPFPVLLEKVVVEICELCRTLLNDNLFLLGIYVCFSYTDWAKGCES